MATCRIVCEAQVLTFWRYVLALLVGTPACRSDEKAPAYRLCPFCGCRRRSALSRSGPRRPIRLHRRIGHGLSGVYGAGSRTRLAGLCQGRRQGLGGIRSRRPRTHADLGRFGPRPGPGEDGDPVLSLRRARSGHGPGPFPGTTGDRPPRPRAGGQPARTRPVDVRGPDGLLHGHGRARPRLPDARVFHHQGDDGHLFPARGRRRSAGHRLLPEEGRVRRGRRPAAGARGRRHLDGNPL